MVALNAYIKLCGGGLELTIIVCLPGLQADNVYNIGIGKTARPASIVYSVLCGYACPVSPAPASTYRAYKALAAFVRGQIVPPPLDYVLSGFFSVHVRLSSLGYIPLLISRFSARCSPAVVRL